MAIKRKLLKDVFGRIIFPRTSTACVYDEVTQKRLDNVLDEINNNLAQMNEKKEISFTKTNAFDISANNYAYEKNGIVTLNINGGVTAKSKTTTKIGTINKTFNKMHRFFGVSNMGDFELTINQSGEINFYSYGLDYTGTGILITATFID